MKDYYYKETGTMLFHQGFTDIVNCLPLINIFSKKFKKINLIMRDDFKEIVDFYLKQFSNVEACYHEKFKIDNHLSQVISLYSENSTMLIFGMYDGYRTHEYINAYGGAPANMFFVESFYTPYDIDYSNRVSMFEFERDFELEEKTYLEFISKHGNDYILYHGMNDENIVELKKLNPNSKFVDLNKATNTFFDYIKILENSKEIHLLDSIWGAFVYQIDSKYGLFINIPITTHCLRGYIPMFTEPIKLNNWIIK